MTGARTIKFALAVGAGWLALNVVFLFAWCAAKGELDLLLEVLRIRPNAVVTRARAVIVGTPTWILKHLRALRRRTVRA